MSDLIYDDPSFITEREQELYNLLDEWKDEQSFNVDNSSLGSLLLNRDELYALQQQRTLTANESSILSRIEATIESRCAAVHMEEDDLPF